MIWLVAYTTSLLVMRRATRLQIARSKVGFVDLDYLPYEPIPGEPPPDATPIVHEQTDYVSARSRADVERRVG